MNADCSAASLGETRKKNEDKGVAWAESNQAYPATW